MRKFLFVAAACLIAAPVAAGELRSRKQTRVLGAAGSRALLIAIFLICRLPAPLGSRQGRRGQVHGWVLGLDVWTVGEAGAPSGRTTRASESRRGRPSLASQHGT